MEKLQKLEEQQQLERWKLLTDEEKEARKEETLLLVGGMLTVNRMADSLKSQEIRALEKIQNEKRYIDLGFEKFVDFLNSSYCKVSKSKYYNYKEILDSEGDNNFDLLNEYGIPLRTRKLLAESNYGDIEIDGDIIKIGDDEADLSDLKMVKALIEKFSDDCRQLTDKSQKQTDNIKKLESTIEKGKAEVEELQRALEDAHTSSYDKALMTILLDFVKLNEEAQKTEITASRREADLRSVWNQMLNYKDTLKKDFLLEDNSPATKNAKEEMDPKIYQALAEDDDWGDE